ncbi:hypothetical protein KBX35_12770 [Micromonospora sp. C32]|uniref:hypothetical protein n=1 Tax=unclassified Micromonospora TaxID=2617518 RepID=UPI001B3604A5|nr:MULTISPECIES: hypothetical protein [unclassified Micromonospora]MBQ1044650.1 hypothetical protein [Micromonospora sp. C72]MBQ1055658.1 hypothetical protein [Micromonospora sp. C32]
MATVDGVELPAYFEHYDTPVKLVATPDGGYGAWKLDRSTGGWRPADDLVDDVIGGIGGDIYVRSADAFVQHVEQLRGRYLRGEGEIFALYDRVRAINERAAAEKRNYTADEAALVSGIRRQTFAMFEEQLQRAGDPGADPGILDGPGSKLDGERQ